MIRYTILPVLFAITFTRIVICKWYQLSLNTSLWTGLYFTFHPPPKINWVMYSKAKSPRTHVCTDHFIVCVHKIRAMYYRNTPCKEAHVWLAVPIRSCCIFILFLFFTVSWTDVAHPGHGNQKTSDRSGSRQS
jgi:hypothetical protein